MRSISNFWHRIIAIFAFNLLTLAAFAQDKGIDIDIDVKKEKEWYQQPWVWVVAAAVFILLLAAILRGGKRSGK